ncbi:MAG: GNAT family N-acetyltransferase [Eubacteriales bacterium]|nr:GNAT family N-acetyltransferase [Eubacteriales bacterium]HCA30723.1 hypothetical protein [Oscillospiraceae bacterium]
MEIDIRPLSLELLDDYLHFFDNVAFADHPEWSQCYCLAFHFEPAWDTEDANHENPWRERAIKFVREGRLQGYLVYADGAVVGWCNTNDKTNYAALKHEIYENSDNKKVKSVVCFLVASDMRGKGFATKMLERVCAERKPMVMIMLRVIRPLECAICLRLTTEQLHCLKNAALKFISRLVMNALCESI